MKKAKCGDEVLVWMIINQVYDTGGYFAHVIRPAPEYDDYIAIEDDDISENITESNEAMRKEAENDRR